MSSKGRPRLVSSTSSRTFILWNLVEDRTVFTLSIGGCSGPFISIEM